MTFADLKIKALETGLNPRLDMVWTHGMPEWKPAEEIDGLFERRTAPEVQATERSADPYRPPEHKSSEEIVGQEGEWPGARRRKFLLTIVAMSFIFNLGIPFATPLLQQQFGKDTGGMMVIGLMILAVFIVFYISLQRLANLGMSRWWYLANLVPFLNLWIAYRCCACPAGYAYHKKLDGVGIFLAIIYWLMIVVVLLAIAAVIAVFLGALGPEFKQQFDEILEQATKLQK